MTAPIHPEPHKHVPPIAIGPLDYPRTVPPPSGEYEWVYLWDKPLRYMHWVAALCIVALVVTGLYVGRPYFMTSGEASSHFLMGKVRFVHFLSAAVLVMTGIVRVYWLFMGNRFERWSALFPVRRRDRKNFVQMVKFYLFIHPERAPKYLGHHPLQQLSYTGVYAITFLMVLTGFAMYGQSDPGGFFYLTTNWVNALFGGAPIVRFVHHVLTWAFLIFLPLHIYLSIRADHLERTGTLSSIISGGRFVPADEEFADGQP